MAQKASAAPHAANLDSMMMAYSDLSCSSKGSSFKGPPVKDIKVQKASAPSFKPSEKARDWSCLAQNLEDAFSLNPTMTAHNSAASFPSLPAQQPFVSRLPPQQQTRHQGNLQSLPPHQQHSGIRHPQAHPSSAIDDWGDFQSFTAAPHPKSLEPAATRRQFSPLALYQPQKQGPKMAATEVDDFADFVAARPQPAAAKPFMSKSVAASNPTNMMPAVPADPLSPVPSPILATSFPIIQSQSSRLNKISTDDEFGDFADSATPIPEFANFTKTPGFSGGTGSVSSAADYSSSKTNIISNFNFEMFRTSARVAAAAPVPVPVQSQPPTALSVGTVLAPVKKSSSGDKYGALRSIFDVDEEVVEATKSAIHASSEMSTIPQTPSTPSKPLALGAATEDDFGDFIDATQSTSSVVPFSAAQPMNPQLFTASNSVFMPQPASTTCIAAAASSVIVPWLSSSPPPPPDDPSDLENKSSFFPELESASPDIDDAEESAVPGMSSLATFDNDDFYSQLELTPVDSEPVPPPPPQASSSPDFLEPPPPAKTPELQLSATSSRKTSDDSLQFRTISEDRYSSIQELSSRTKNESSNGPASAVTAAEVWLKATREISKLIGDAARSFESIADDQDVLQDVVESERGSDYIKNLREIYAVFKRIRLSYDEADDLTPNDVVLENLGDELEAIEKHWTALKSSIAPAHNLKDATPSVAESPVEEQQENMNPIANYITQFMLQSLSGRLNFNCRAGKVSATIDSNSKCGLCLRNLQGSGSFDASNIANLSHGIDSYHAACANFWVNRVAAALPALS